MKSAIWSCFSSHRKQTTPNPVRDIIFALTDIKFGFPLAKKTFLPLPHRKFSPLLCYSLSLCPRAELISRSVWHHSVFVGRALWIRAENIHQRDLQSRYRRRSRDNTVEGCSLLSSSSVLPCTPDRWCGEKQDELYSLKHCRRQPRLLLINLKLSCRALVCYDMISATVSTAGVWTDGACYDINSLKAHGARINNHPSSYLFCWHIMRLWAQLPHTKCSSISPVIYVV